MRYQIQYKTNLIISVLGLFVAVLSARLGWTQEPMISAGYAHTCAILETGEAKCWGNPGDGRTILPLGFENAKWKSISAGYEHTCGILENGEAKCWGINKNEWTKLPLGFENANWFSIVAGYEHNCGILEKSREMKCWGDRKYGKTTLPNGLEHAKWKAISAGYENTCAILESGEAKCWGDQEYGKTTIPTGLERAKWKAISVGNDYICAILENGRAQCWGFGYTMSESKQSSLHSGLENEKWKAISAGVLQTCGLLENGEARCWRGLKDDSIPLPGDLENAEWKAISAGRGYACAILESGEAIHCWGDNVYGQAPPIIRLLPEYPFGISNLELGLEKLMAVVSPVKKTFLDRVLGVLNKLKKPGEQISRANYHALNQRLFLLNALGPFMEDLTSAYEKEHVVPKYLEARKQANAENEIKCLADLECNASLKLLSLELIQITVEALKGQTASNEDHALMENLTAELGRCLAQGGENLSQVLGIFDSAPGKKLFGAFAQSPFTRGFGLTIQSLVEYLRGAR